MPHTELFDPKTVEVFEGGAETNGAGRGGDRRDGSVYVYTDEIKLAVRVALATERPLLVRGPSGSGKSSLARNIARFKRWQYYEEVVSSRTQARDLQWRFDTLRRLSDAQVQQLKEASAWYIEPGVLWWAFDRESARQRGLSEEELKRQVPAIERDKFFAVDPGVDPENEKSDGAAKEIEKAAGGDEGIPRAVVLLDEIDKADPDTPNNLLVPLGSHRFAVQETGATVEARQPPLIIITTNDERELPVAFLRRCVSLTLKGPNEARLVEIAKAHFQLTDDTDEAAEEIELCHTVADYVLNLADEDNKAGRSATPSTAEYLDALRACRELDVRPKRDRKIWEAVAQATLRKTRADNGVNEDEDS